MKDPPAGAEGASKKDFLAMMEKKFDAMDKGKKGMLSVADIMRIFSDKTGQ